MRKLVLLAVVGLLAQLVDGSLGMAYGVTSTTFLLLLGTNPAVASATVHLAEIGTTLVSGTAHWRFGNIDWGVVARIALPGAIGAFAGATFLANLDASAARPIMAIVLLTLGTYVLVRFTFRGPRTDRLGRPLRLRFLAPLGLFGGFIDATGGGGWGPVGTTTILASGRLEPRKVIGSVGASEFVVTLAASVGFLLALGSAGIDPMIVLGLLLGGAIAAPIAAWLVRHIPARILGSLVGGLIVLTNARTVVGETGLGLTGPAAWSVYALLTAIWFGAVAWSWRAYKLESVDEAVAPRDDTRELADDRA